MPILVWLAYSDGDGFAALKKLKILFRQVAVLPARLVPDTSRFGLFWLNFCDSPPLCRKASSKPLTGPADVAE